MQILIHTDRNIPQIGESNEQLEAAITAAASRFVTRITRVEARLSDVNSDKAGVNDKRCVLEARLIGLNPVVVTHQAPTLELAITGASGKLGSALDSVFGRLASGRNHGPDSA